MYFRYPHVAARDSDAYGFDVGVRRARRIRHGLRFLRGYYLRGGGIKKMPRQSVGLSGRIGGGYLLFHFRSIIGVTRFNFSVRNGKRWSPRAMATLVSLRSRCLWFDIRAVWGEKRVWKQKARALAVAPAMRRPAHGSPSTLELSQFLPSLGWLCLNKRLSQPFRRNAAGDRPVRLSFRGLAPWKGFG